MMQDETRTLANTVTEPAEKGFDRAALLSVGGIVAALGAATCCVLPFALFFAGISGAWIGNLTAFEPYQPVFITIALACLGYGFYLVYRRPKAAECPRVPTARVHHPIGTPRSAFGSQLS